MAVIQSSGTIRPSEAKNPRGTTSCRPLRHPSLRVSKYSASDGGMGVADPADGWQDDQQTVLGGGGGHLSMCIMFNKLDLADYKKR